MPIGCSSDSHLALTGLFVVRYYLSTKASSVSSLRKGDKYVAVNKPLSETYILSNGS